MAVLLMVQGHTFSALLAEGQLPGFIGHWHAVLHGLTAPAFLFGDGLAFGTATYPHYQQQRTSRPLLLRRLSRYATLLLLGYTLQLPGGSLAAALRSQDDQLAQICRVGPLQLIGVVLALCQLALRMAPSARTHALGAGALGVAAMLAATPLTRFELSRPLGAFLGAFLEERGGSHFPLLPWAAFILFGIATAGLVHRRVWLRRGPPFIAAGALSALCAYTLYRNALAQPEPDWLWRTSPSYLLFRLGLVVLGLGLLHLPRTHSAPASGRVGWSAMLATHSLVAYVAHLFFLYGTPLTPGLTRAWQGSLSLLPASLACGVILIATLFTTRLWDWLEREQLVLRRHKHAGIALLLLSVLAR